MDVPVEIEKWKYNGKTKRHCFSTAYCKYSVGHNKKNGTYLRYTKLRIRERFDSWRNRSFLYDHVDSVMNAMLIAKDIEKEEQKKHAKSLMAIASTKQIKRFNLIAEMGGKCKRCEFADYRALQFHHIDSSEKNVFSDKSEASLKEVQQHPKRFELICANCHLIHHIVEHQEKRKIMLL